jgi:superfamily II DNA helicase RecQ
MAEALEEYAQHRQRQLDQMTDYAEADACRRRILLSYFSDHGPADAARCCDNCLAEQAPPPAPHDVSTLTRAERAALIILDTVQRLPWGVGRRRIADILKASRAKGMTDIYQQQHYYGRFAEFSRTAIEAMIEHLIVQGYLKMVGGDIPVVALSQRGRQALQARAPIALELPGTSAPAAKPDRKRTSTTSGSTADETAALLRQGLCPADIAAERGLTERTIFKHLADLIGDGRLELSAVVSDDVAAQVRAVIDEVGDLSRLAPLKERLPDEISYDELRCVVESVKRKVMHKNRP